MLDGPFLETLSFHMLFTIYCHPKPDFFFLCLICLFLSFLKQALLTEEMVVVGKALSLSLKVLGWLISVASAPKTVLVYSA